MSDIEQIRAAFDEWERTQVCIRSHVRIVREEVELLIEQLQAAQAYGLESDGLYNNRRLRVLELEEQLQAAERALRDIVDFEIRPEIDAAWHFAEVRLIARNYIERR